jgi:hypothetical protein
MAYSENGERELALSDLNRYIDSTSEVSERLRVAYSARSEVYEELGEKEKADADAAKAEELEKQLANP